MGDWTYGNDGRWHYDAKAPSPGQGASETRMMPAVPAQDDAIAEIYEHGDGAIYGRIYPGRFDSYDRVDSRSIVDNGGPPDAA